MKAQWADGPMVALDAETTGTDPETARSVQAAVVYGNPDGSLDESRSLLTLVNPGVEIPKAASDSTGSQSRSLQGLLAQMMYLISSG